MTISVVVSFIKYSELQVSKNSYLYASIFCFFSDKEQQGISLYQIFKFVHFLPLFEKIKHDPVIKHKSWKEVALKHIHRKQAKSTAGSWLLLVNLLWHS